MKAILISINPKWVAKILNGEKTIEIRKRFPKDYVGWVYIYCTKEKPHLAKSNETKTNLLDLNGKVVARFWCDNVEETKPYMDKEQQKLSCLSTFELMEYLQGKTGYAIHITKLEIFDKPKELKEFFVYSHSVSGVGMDGKDKTFEVLKPLTKAPQSWCHIRDVL